MSYTVKRIKRFLHDIRVELKKVNWPTKNELFMFTGIVIAVILVIGAFFWVLDTGFVAVLKMIIR